MWFIQWASLREARRSPHNDQQLLCKVQSYDSFASLVAIERAVNVYMLASQVADMGGSSTYPFLNVGGL